MTRTGMKVVPKSGNPIVGFTAYKVYTIVSGTGETNLSPTARKFGLLSHSEESANVLDDFGNIRFISMKFFREFTLESEIGKGLFHD